MVPTQLILFTLAFFQIAGTTGGPKIEANLHTENVAAVAGATNTIAVEISLESGWHMYHPIHLDAGGPTRITFHVPEGVTFTELRFPEPTYGETAGIPYLGYEDSFIILTDMVIAPTAELGETLRIDALVKGFACHDDKGCVPVTQRATLALPVSATESDQPEENEFFADARDLLPKPLKSADFIAGSSVEVKPAEVGLREKADLVVTIRVRPGHHIQDQDPGVEDLIPSKLYVESISGIVLEDQIWPKPNEKLVLGFGKVREQSGKFEIRVPFTIQDAKFAAGPVNLRVLFTYQCCTDAGSCYPPMAAEAVATFTAATENDPLPAGNAHGTLYPTVKHGPPPTQTPADNDNANTSHDPTAATSASQPLWWILILGFLGGMILNVMPCVLPVISIKILSFVNQAAEDPGRVLRLGIAFCAGIMLWFWMFAALSAAGQFHLQDPLVVVILATIMFLFSLNLFGVFEIVLPGSATGTLDEFTHREGYLGSFFKGFLATVLGTACTAPLLAPALAYASTQPGIVGFAIFSSAGLGMAAPYLLLSANPAWLKFVPKPGNWMVIFKQATGFILIGTAIWLLWVLNGILGGDGVVWTTAFWAFVALAAWLIGKIGFNWTTRARLTTYASAVAILLYGWYFSYHVMFDWEKALAPVEVVAHDTPVQEIAARAIEADWSDGIPWQHWRPNIAEDLAAAGYTTYVDYTAKWCATCQANKAAVLETDDIRAAMSKAKVIPIEGDFTKRNPRIAEVLARYDRPTVPLNLIYPAGKPEDPIVLPVVLTKSTVSEALNAAGPTNAPKIAAVDDPKTDEQTD